MGLLQLYVYMAMWDQLGVGVAVFAQQSAQ